MAKKNLTDLLREEVEKSPSLEPEQVEESTDDQTIKQDTEAVETSPMTMPAKPNSKPSIPTKSDLEATIVELKSALEEAQQKPQDGHFSELKDDLEEAYRKEGALQQQISDLQSDLQHYKKSVHKLEKELEKTDNLKTELEQAKKAALQLAQANEKLTQEITTLKKGETQIQKGPGHEIIYHPPDRPIQKEIDKPADFAKTSWLL
jgi:chromosome segregation ATPase